MADIKIGRVVEKYMRLRSDKERIVNETKAITAKIQEEMNLLETYIMQQMEVDDVTSYKTKHGTAFKTTRDFAKVGDWDSMLEFVRKNDAWQLLEKRVSKQAVQSYLDAGEPLPPGVDWTSVVEINIRKPSGE